jgi:hypothetical protein
MKTMKSILLVCFAAGFLLSCNRTDFTDNYPGNDLKKSRVEHEVIIVTPSGGDDTENLYAAIAEAMSYGHGNVVRLAEGEYYLGCMEIRDFYGTLTGAGKDQTIITLLPEMDIDVLWAQGLMHSQIRFAGGDVTLKNFTIQTPPGPVSTGGPDMGHILSIFNFSAFNAVYELGNQDRSISVDIDNVRFKGQFLEGGPGYVNSYNCFIGVRAGFDCFPNVWTGTLIPREKINFRVTNSEFDTFCYGLALEGLKNSKAVVGGMNAGNVFSNTDQLGGIWESRDFELVMEGNEFNVPWYSYGWDIDDSSWYPNLLEDEFSTRASLCNIRANTFNLESSTYGLYLNNRRQLNIEDEIPIAFQVKNNHFNMTDWYPWGIISLRTKGAVIRNNIFRGNGDIGIYLRTYSSGGLVLGNNFSGSEYGTAAIYLHSSTSDFTVIGGGNNNENVINNGTNNIISGVNVSSSDVPPGRTIHEILPPMNHLMH